MRLMLGSLWLADRVAVLIMRLMLGSLWLAERVVVLIMRLMLGSLWLAERVAVLNTARELTDLQRSCLGRCNILVAYVPSLGATGELNLLPVTWSHGCVIPTSRH